MYIPDQCLNIFIDIFSKNKCIMSTGNERGNFVDLSSKSILRLLIPNNNKNIYKN
jgi:hypothetical protein